MSAQCHLVARRMPLTGPDRSLGPTLDAHLAECLVCQAEAVRHRKLLRVLAALADDLEPAPAGLAASVAADIDATQRTRRPPLSLGRRVAAATGAVAATAAGFVAVALWKRARQAA